MNKETMIWQTHSMIIAGMAMHKKLPATEKEFETKVISEARSILLYSEEEIKNVLYTTNCTEWAEILCQLFKTPTTPTATQS